MHANQTGIALGLVILLSLAACRTFAAEGGDPPRIGWEENFDDISLWEKALLNPVHGTPVASVKGGNGTINIVTQCGALNPGMKRDDWPEWPKKPASSFTNFDIQTGKAVDFSVYRYLVVRVLEKATFSYVAINGKGTKVLYTTGIHSQDLGPLGLKGKQGVRIYGQFLNTSGNLKLDYIRLVRELTPEEKAGFIGEGLTIREEKVKGHPYHGLEALNARAGRPGRRDPVGGEWCAFRDVATGAEIWRMTAGPANENDGTFNCDGSAFIVKARGGRGFHVFDFESREFKLVEGGLSDARPRFSTTQPSMIIMAENEWLQPRPLRRLSLHRYDFRTGKKEEFASFKTKATWRVQELSSSPDSDKLVFGFRETPTVFLIDPSIPEKEKRCREITLTTRLKGVSLINKDKEIRWHNCYTYQGWIMDLATGKVSHGNSPCAGGHSAGGPHFTVGPYGQMMKLLVRNGLHPQTEATADDIRIFANYKSPVPTDYGRVSPNGRWVVTNGVRGDVSEQHLMIAIDDPATVLRTTMYNTSRNDWPTNTYSRSSPDVTKVAFVSDHFGDGDVYMAVTGRPAPPTSLQASGSPRGNRVALNWKEPEGVREIAGYRIYRSATSGRGFVPLNRAPLKGTSYMDREPLRSPAFYLVAAVEPSGIEGHFSSEVAIGTRRETPRTIFVEAETCAWKPPIREVLRGEASGSRYLRLHRASEEEPDAGEITVKVDLPEGKYTAWLCGRAEDSAGQWDLFPSPADGKLMASFKLGKGTGFTWVRGDRPVSIGRRDARGCRLTSSAIGIAVDKIAFSTDSEFDPNRMDLRAGGPGTEKPKSVSELKAVYVKPQSLVLRWKESPSPNVARYDVHCGGTDAPESLGNETVIGSAAGATLSDWGLRPGTKYVYRVVSVDSRGNRSDPVKLEVTTAAAKAQVLEADAASAEKDDRVKIADGFATLPDQVAGRDKAEKAKIAFAVEAEEEGPFMLWAQYRPAYVKGRGLSVGVQIDGKDAGSWRLRAPYRPMGWTLAKSGGAKVRTFSDKIVAGGKDVHTLTKGRHTVTLVLDPKLGASQHAFAKIWATNDHSWRPPGYDPRANFKKR